MKPTDTAPPKGNAGGADAAMLPPGPSAARPPVSPQQKQQALSAIAQNMRVTLARAKGGDLDTMLATQAHLLDALFQQLMLHGAAGPCFDERFGLALALRAQKQCRHTVEALSILKARRDPLR